tara:strand:- start:1412 stop:2125 length:714 start_codon:yes stop_codon:yes gene_type:complete
MIKEQIGDATLYLGDSNDFEKIDFHQVVVYDPPFDLWSKVKIRPSPTAIAFCSPQSRDQLDKKLGKPRTELVWHFSDGRWVSPNLPRITHDYIYVYGDVGDASVGDYQPIKTQKKGKSSIGKDCLGDRIYTSKNRKHINSVQIFPRNMSVGAWNKPVNLLYRLLEWVDADTVFDPFMGGGSTGVACVKLGLKFTGVEINKKIFDVACERIRQQYLQPDLLINYSHTNEQIGFNYEKK